MDNGDTVPDRKNFDSLLWAIVTVFQVRGETVLAVLGLCNAHTGEKMGLETIFTKKLLVNFTIISKKYQVTHWITFYIFK